MDKATIKMNFEDRLRTKLQIEVKHETENKSEFVIKRLHSSYEVCTLNILNALITGFGIVSFATFV